MKKIIVVAGDKSGDLYGGLLSKRIKEECPKIEIFSFGGENLAQNSYQIINLLSHSVSGIFEVALSLKRLFDIFKKVVEEIKRINPDLIILIDFPDFNLRLAKTLNKKYPLFYYVSPQVWAWRKKRINLIKKYVHKMIVIFEFEKEFYANAGVDVLYFGHPLLEIVKKSKIETKKIISFMPGSRKNEIKRHLPVMEKVKTAIQNALYDYHFRIIKPSHIEEAFYKKIGTNMQIVPHSYEVIEESKFIITSSGTATVEIALLEVPFLIIYKINPLTWHILKKIVNTKFIGMVNILASKKIVNELLQKEANPENITKITLEYLKNKEKYEELKNNLREIKEKLTPYGAIQKFAEFIVEFLTEKNLSKIFQR
jgi:lipid-A-disaccharide synthase